MATEATLHQLHPGLRRLVIERGWGGLRPIQERALEAIFAGGDCLVEAPTAGGKTEAVLFPTLTRAATQEGRGVRVLFLAPLRALLNNLQHRGENYAKACGMLGFKWHGDVSQKKKLEQLRDPPELLMTTPESLEAILLRKTEWRLMFASTRAVIIDEAHNFAAGDRGGHLLALLARLEKGASHPIQRIAVSATIGNPNAMLAWLVSGREDRRAQRVHVRGEPGRRDYRIEHFDLQKEEPDTPPHQTERYRYLQKYYQLIAGNKALVFVRSRRRAESLCSALGKLGRASGRPLKVRTHHSAVSRFFREEAEERIQVASEDGVDAIVSTSTLELGIDIGELDLVVQDGALASPGSFLQRVGRTGRRAGKPQYFRGLITEDDDVPLLAATVSLAIEGRSERLLLPRRAFHLLAHQLVCLSLQENGVSVERAWSVLRCVHCFSGIQRSELDTLVDHMVSKEWLRRVDDLLVVGAEGERVFLAANWRRLFAVFDAAPAYEVVDGKTHVGTLDASFVESLPLPFLFALAGRVWKTEKVDHDRRQIAARRAEGGNAPRWQVFGGPDVPRETAQEAGRLLHGDQPVPFLDPHTESVLQAQRHERRSIPWRPGLTLVFANAGGRARIITFAGDRQNRTLARWLELQGIGRTTASYEHVLVTRGADAPHELSAQIEAELKRLRSPKLDHARFARSLAAAQPLYPFSPYARYLPERLWAESLAERALDPEGLLAHLSEAPEGDSPTVQRPPAPSRDG